MKNIWRLVARFFSFAYMGSGLYGAWSKVYRFIWERKYRDIDLRTFTMPQLVEMLGQGVRWRADSWRALWDAFSSPQRVQTLLSQATLGEEHDIDCDDYASFCSNAIRVSLAAGLMQGEKIQVPRILTVAWMEGWKPAGHNVTLLEKKTDVGTVFAYMDYFAPSTNFNSVDDVAKAVIARYSAGATPLLWCAIDPVTLKPWATKML